LFALKALLDWEAMNSNNVKGGTILAEARRAMKTPLAEARSAERLTIADRE
jgi:hypothetical protein